MPALSEVILRRVQGRMALRDELRGVSEVRRGNREGEGGRSAAAEGREGQEMEEVPSLQVFCGEDRRVLAHYMQVLLYLVSMRHLSSPILDSVRIYFSFVKNQLEVY